MYKIITLVSFLGELKFPQKVKMIFDLDNLIFFELILVVII